MCVCFLYSGSLSPLGVRDAGLQRKCARYRIRWHPLGRWGCTTPIWTSVVQLTVFTRGAGNLTSTHLDPTHVAAQVWGVQGIWVNVGRKWSLHEITSPGAHWGLLAERKGSTTCTKCLNGAKGPIPAANHQEFTVRLWSWCEEGASLPLHQMLVGKWCKEAPACTEWPPNPLRRRSYFDLLQKEIWISPELDNNLECNQLLDQ